MPQTSPGRVPVVVPTRVDGRQEDAEVTAGKQERLDLQRQMVSGAQRDAVALQDAGNRAVHERNSAQGKRHVRCEEIGETEHGENHQRPQEHPPAPPHQERKTAGQRGEVQVPRNPHEVVGPPAVGVVVHVHEQHHPESRDEQAVPEQRPTTPALALQKRPREQRNGIRQVFVVGPLAMHDKRQTDGPDRYRQHQRHPEAERPAPRSPRDVGEPDVLVTLRQPRDVARQGHVAVGVHVREHSRRRRRDRVLGTPPRVDPRVMVRQHDRSRHAVHQPPTRHEARRQHERGNDSQFAP